MREVQLRDAKARLSAVVDQAARGEPSVITRHGRRAAVALGFDERRRLAQVPSFARLRRLGSVRRAGELGDWLGALLHLYARRILAFDLAAARIAGALADLAEARGASPGFADLAIAATARAQDLPCSRATPAISRRWTSRWPIPSQRSRLELSAAG